MMMVTMLWSNAAESAQHGKASIYTTKCNGGTKTASGTTLSNNSNMIAHRTLPFGTEVLITNKHNGKSTIGIVRDRGPFIRGRIVDLTLGVADKIGLTKKQGICNVKLEVVGKIKSK